MNIRKAMSCCCAGVALSFSAGALAAPIVIPLLGYGAIGINSNTIAPVHILVAPPLPVGGTVYVNGTLVESPTLPGLARDFEVWVGSNALVFIHPGNQCIFGVCNHN